MSEKVYILNEEEFNKYVSIQESHVKCSELLNKYRNLMKELSHICKCDENFKNKIKLNHLEKEYKYVINKENQMENNQIINYEDIEDINDNTIDNNFIFDNSLTNDINESPINDVNIDNEEEVETRFQIAAEDNELDLDYNEFNIETKYQCNECNECFDNKKVLETHKYEIHSICVFNKISVDKWEPTLTQSVKSVPNYKRYKCHHKNCRKKFASTHLLQNHIISMHKKKKKNVKNYDLRHFKTNSSLKSNSKTDMGSESCGEQCEEKEQTFVCNYENCRQIFATKDALDMHDCKHSVLKHIKRQGKYFICDIKTCGRKLATKQSLITHLNRHSGVKNFECEDINCDKRFYSAQELKKHFYLIHSGLKPFVCDYFNCDKRYGSKEILKNHIKIVHQNKRKAIKTKK